MFGDLVPLISMRQVVSSPPQAVRSTAFQAPVHPERIRIDPVRMAIAGVCHDALDIVPIPPGGLSSGQTLEAVDVCEQGDSLRLLEGRVFCHAPGRQFSVKSAYFVPRSIRE